ncbi:MAG: sulfatase-like hydrolase/transferase [Bacteroidota bacterium]
MRLSFLLFFIASTLSAQDQPNIVWFISEDNSPYLGCYGDTLVRTPHLDAFAEEAILYHNAFSNAPVCAPSRSTIITGMYPTTLGSQHMRSSVEIAPDYRFFPAYLREAGYYTTLRLKRDYNIPSQPGTWDLDEWWHLEDALPERTAEQPYFLMYNTWMSHEGKIHPSEDRWSYFKSTFERTPEDSVQHMINSISKVGPAEVQIPPYLPDLPEVRADLAQYYEVMEATDIEFGHVIEQLKASGEWENTILIYSSDHGGVLGRSKRFPLESGLKVPLLIRFPERWQHLAPSAMGSQTEAVVSFVDMAPSILEMAGLDAPDHFQGNSFLQPPTHNRDQYAFGFRGRMDETYDMVRTVRDRRYRYVRNYNRHRPAGQRVNFLWQAANLQAWEAAYDEGKLNATEAAFFEPRPFEALYDCRADPHNVHNLIDDPAHRGQLLRLRAALLMQESLTNDLGAIPEGQLFALHETNGQRYQEIADSLPMRAIRRAAELANFPTTRPSAFRSLLRHQLAAMRYWGATGYLIQGTDSQRSRRLLKRALQDESGDVATVAAEALFHLGEEAIAIATFERLLTDENPFVVLRVANTLEATRADSPLIRERLQAIAEREPKGRFDFAIRKASYLLTLYETP